MKELLKNLKTLFFSYLSATLLLFFAVLQSNQQQYDSALQQLREIEQLAANFDPKAIEKLILEKAPENYTNIRKSFRIETIDTVLSVSFNGSYLDYSELKGKLERQTTPGFQFSPSNQENYPTEFTEVSEARTYLLGLLPPKNVADYAHAHNQVLDDIIIPLLSPNFSNARIEAFRYRTTSHNSIESITIGEYEKHKVFDPLTLEKLGENLPATTVLKMVKTKEGGKYAFLGDMPGFEHNSIKYSGARILLPAHYSNILLSKHELMDIYNVPDDKRLPFKRSYRELAESTEAYADLEFEKVQTILESEKSRNPSTLSLFGAQINVSLLTKVAFPTLVLMCLYMFLHLQEANRRFSDEGKADFDVPWIGIYSNPANRYAVMAQLLLLPLLLMTVIQWKAKGGLETAIGWLFCATLLVVNYFNYQSVNSLRKKIQKSQKG